MSIILQVFSFDYILGKDFTEENSNFLNNSQNLLEKNEALEDLENPNNSSDLLKIKAV